MSFAELLSRLELCRMNLAVLEHGGHAVNVGNMPQCHTSYSIFTWLSRLFYFVWIPRHWPTFLCPLGACRIYPSGVLLSWPKSELWSKISMQKSIDSSFVQPLFILVSHGADRHLRSWWSQASHLGEGIWKFQTQTVHLPLIPSFQEGPGCPTFKGLHLPKVHSRLLCMCQDIFLK